MIGVGKCNDFGPTGLCTSKLDRSIICLRSAVAEADHDVRMVIIPLREQLDQFFSVLNHRNIVGVDRRKLNALVHLLGDSFHDGFLSATDIQRRRT